MSRVSPASPAPTAPDRDESLLKVYSLWLVEPDQARTLVAERRSPTR